MYPRKERLCSGRQDGVKRGIGRENQGPGQWGNRVFKRQPEERMKKNKSILTLLEFFSGNDGSQLKTGVVYPNLLPIVSNVH